MGLIVALVGIDGSGKTTQAFLLYNALKNHGFKSKVFYAGNTGIKVGRNHSFYLSLPIDIILKRLLKVYSRPIPPTYGILSRLECLLLFLNYVILVLPRILVYSKIYRLLITDRYLYDYFLSTILQGANSRTLMGVLLRMVPKPTITILLDVDPLTAYHRKDAKKPLDELWSLRLLYRCFIVSVGGKIINASSSKIYTFKEILRVVKPCVLQK